MYVHVVIAFVKLLWFLQNTAAVMPYTFQHECWLIVYVCTSCLLQFVKLYETVYVTVHNTTHVSVLYLVAFFHLHDHVN